MQRWYDFIADYNGKPLAGATVQVQNYPALTNATYYLTTDTSAPLTVPLTSGADGGIAFYAADGRYQLTITATNGRITIIPDILIEDPAEGTVPIALSASTATWAIEAGTSGYAGTAGNAGTSAYSGTAGFVAGAVAIASTATYAITAGTATANASLNGSADEVFLVSTATAVAQAIRKDQFDAGVAGSVIQTVFASYATETSSSSSTFADTGLTATITPKYATSKILVIATQAGLAKDTGNTAVKVQLLRDTTALILFAFDGFTADASRNDVGGSGCTYLDSPSTASPVTYKTQFASTANIAAAYVQRNSTVSTITLMEIAQ